MKNLQILMMNSESYASNQLVFEIEVLSNGIYDMATLLKPNGGGTKVYNFTIDYGDESTIESKSGTNIQTDVISHTYTSGTYTLTLTGDVPAFGTLYGGIANIDILRVFNWGEIQEMTLYGESNLTSIPQKAIPDLYNDYFDWNLFKNTAITQIPSNLFDNQTDPNSTFYELPETFLNTPITSIPSGLFDFISASIPIDFSATFKGCTSVTNSVDDVWNDANATCVGGDCFEGAVNIENYDDIPDGWKGL